MSGAKSSVLENRYSSQGQDAIIKDIFKLALSDFLVCTFSSNVCRLAYELRMALRPFVSHLYEVISLDMDYFFQYGNDIDYVTLREHSNFQLGDNIKVEKCFIGCKTPKHYGTNVNNNQSGPFTRSKVKRLYLTSHKYPLPPFQHF